MNENVKNKFKGKMITKLNMFYLCIESVSIIVQDENSFDSVQRWFLSKEQTYKHVQTSG